MVLSIVLAVVILGAVGFFLVYTHDDGLIYDNVYALDINLGGMTQEEAQAVLEEKGQEVYAQPLTVELQDRSLVLTPEDTGAKLDAAALAQAAFDYGRDGNVFQRVKARSDAEINQYELDAYEYVDLNESYVNDAVTQMGEEIFTELSQPQITVEGQKPDVTKYMIPDAAPRDAEEEKEEEQEDETNQEQEQENETAPEITVIDPDEPYVIEGGQTMTIRKGVPGRKLDTEAMMEAIHKAYGTGDFSVITMTYEVVDHEPTDLKALFDEYCIAPVESVLDLDTYVASKETLGYGFDIETLQKQLDEAEEGSEVVTEFILLVPENTKMNLEADLFSDSLAKVETAHTRNQGRTTNLRLACEAIDGMILKPGETFSFNDVVGERTPEKGYKEAIVYSGQNSVPETGGGVCQVASTLYYGALLADLEIVERAVHTFSVSYVPMGMDATIYWGSLDFKFKNNTDYPIKILISVHDGSVWLEYLGTETKDYYVEMEWEQTSRTGWDTIKVPYTEANRKQYPGYGIGDTIVHPYTGYTGYSYKLKYDRETGELISREKEDYSSYNKRDKKVFVAAPDENPDPKPAEPAETKPAETKPAETKPAETKPVNPPEVKPSDPPAPEPEPAPQPEGEA